MNQIEPRRNPKMLGAVLIALGILLMLGQVLDFQSFHLYRGDIPSPLSQIVAGIVISTFGLALFKRPVVTILGVMLAVGSSIEWLQDGTGASQIWDYSWALVVPTSIGLGMLLHGEVIHQPALISRGTRLIAIGLALFGIFYAYFQFRNNLDAVSQNLLDRLVGPALLIGLGLYTILRRRASSVEEEFKIKVK